MSGPVAALPVQLTLAKVKEILGDDRDRKIAL